MDSDEKKDLIYKFILIIVFVTCITVIITLYATFFCMERNHFLVTADISDDSKENINVISKSLKDFRKMIDKYYIGDIDEKKLAEETIKGYIKGLDDEYSEYMTPEEWEEFQISTLGNYVGIGVYIGEDENKKTEIIEPIEETPAQEAGLKSGDIIVEIDGENVLDKGVDYVSSKIKGEEGSKAKMKILRDDQYIDLEVTRKQIKVYKIKGEMLENNIGYIDVPTFDEGCNKEFEEEYNKLVSEGAQKLIIDLRNNTGGIVDEALNIADMFLEKDKTLLFTVDAQDNKVATKSQQDPIVNIKDIVILANGYTASASEILIGALRDNIKVTVVGQKTYGKGVIQNVFSLTDGGVLKLTTAEYFTPNETKINKQGIKPDVEVKNEKEPEGVEEIDEQLNKAKELLK